MFETNGTLVSVILGRIVIYIDYGTFIGQMGHEFHRAGKQRYRLTELGQELLKRQGKEQS
jgi:hypothetical protein